MTAPAMAEGEAFVAEPWTSEAAQRVLAAAEAAGHDSSVVRTADGGYLVPEDVIDKLYPPKPTEEGKK